MTDRLKHTIYMSLIVGILFAVVWTLIEYAHLLFNEGRLFWVILLLTVLAIMFLLGGLAFLVGAIECATNKQNVYCTMCNNTPPSVYWIAGSCHNEIQSMKPYWEAAANEHLCIDCYMKKIYDE